MGELAAGVLVGRRYRVVKLLGQGGMGAVYHAVHEDLGRPVALKVLPKRFATDPHMVARFKREAETMAALQHPNIVQVNDFAFEPDGTTHLVMELLHGESLEQRLRLGPLEADEALLVTRQITEALAAAHDHGVVHRDLKPANVFLTPIAGAGVIVKLLDFGIAKLLDDGLRLTSTGALIGTPRYMSPEQIRGRSVTPATDVWALGVCVFEMVTGRAPFQGDGLPALVPQILGDTPPALPDHVQEPLRSLITQALRKDPTGRPATASEVRRLLTSDLRAFASTVRAPDAQPPTPAPANATLPTIPTRFPRWPLVAALVVAGALGAAALWDSDEPTAHQESSPLVPVSHELDSPSDVPEHEVAVQPAGSEVVSVEPAAPELPTSTSPRQGMSVMRSVMRSRSEETQPVAEAPAEPVQPPTAPAETPSMDDDPAEELIDVFPE